MAKNTVSIIIKADGSEAKKEAQKTGDALEDMNKRAAKSARGAIDGFKALGGKLQSIGQSAQFAGASLTAAFTAPIGALATLGIKSALTLDQSRTRLTALLGSVDAANARMEALKKISTNSVGVLFNGALESDTALRAAGIKGEETINKLIKGMGKLNAAFTIEDQGGFIRNLSQIFSQGFEIQDMKEAVGRVPIFYDLLNQAFKTNDGKQLKKMKESGKLTMDGFMSGLADAMANNSATANIQDNLTTKLQKGMEQLNIALAALGDVLLKTVVPALSQLVPYVQQIGEAFAAMDPSVQNAIIAFGGLLAAVGPLLVAIGGIASGLGAVMEAAAGVAGAIASIGGLGAAAGVIAIVAAGIAQLALVAGALYVAWETNFGGIRDLAKVVADAVLSAWDSAMAALQDLTSSVLAELTAFWTQNGADIMTAVKAISDGIRSIWSGIVNWITANQDTIKAVISAVWNAIKTIVVGAIRIVSNTIKLVMSVVKGDWSGGWDALKTIVGTALDAVVATAKASVSLVVGAVKLIFSGIWDLASWVLEEGQKLGANLVNGLTSGMQSKQGVLMTVARTLIMGPLAIFREVPEIHSPSRVTTEIGEHMGQGLADGLKNKLETVKGAARQVATEAVKALRDAQKEFSKLAGAGPETVATIQKTNELQDATQAQQEIIKLRAELKLRKNEPLPTDVAGTQNELKDLQELKKKADDFNEMLDSIAKIPEEIAKAEREAIQALAAGLEEKKKALQEAGAADVLKLQEEIQLTGVLDEAERTRISNIFELKRLREEMLRDGYSDKQIREAQAVARAEQARRAELERILSVKKQIAAAGDLEKDLVNEIDNIRRNGEPITAYEETLRRITQDLKDISPAQKQRLLDLAAEADALRELQKEQNKVRDIVGKLVDAGFEHGFKGVLDSIRSMYRDWLKNMVKEFLTSQFFKLMRGGQGSGTGGSIFSQIPGLGGLGIPGGGGTPPFVAPPGSFFGSPGGAGAGGGFGGLATGGLPGAPGSPSNPTANVGGVFSSKPGGMFAPRTNILNGSSSATAGYMAGVGQIAAMAGAFVPGWVGNMLSMAGTGMQIGAMFGPWGAAIGAGVGALVGFFMGDPKKKKDQRENMPALQKGFADSTTELQNLIRDVRRLAADPDSAVARARAIRSEVASGFGIQFGSKKYQKQSQADIARKLVEIDAIIRELEGAADVARAANERGRRMLPEFAGGVFLRRNGLLAGTWTGRDTLPSMLAPGEMVLNPKQQARVRLNAGGDPFDGAGIPGYAGGVYVQGSSSSSPERPLQVPISISIDRDGLVQAWAESPDGRRVLVSVVEKAYRNDEMKLSRRF